MHWHLFGGEHSMGTQVVLNLGPGLMPNFSTGAMFHSILAWPAIEESATRQKVSEELMAQVIRLTKAQDPTFTSSLMNEWPQFDWPSIEARARKRKPALGVFSTRPPRRQRLIGRSS